MSLPRQIDPARLRAARERLGLSELQLARRIHVSSSTINRAAHGHHSLSSDTMRKLCLELGVSEAYLFGDDETDDIGSMLPMLTAEQRSQVRGYIEGILSRSGEPSGRVENGTTARRNSRKPVPAKRSPEQPK